jgi:hypothetical protein
LPLIYTVEPGSAIVIGIVAFGGHIVHMPVAIVVEAVAVSGVVAGVVILSRAQLVLTTERARARARRLGQ